MFKIVLPLTLLGLILTGLCTPSAPTRAADEQTIAIGTAGRTGVYYPTGNAICRLVNRSRDKSGVHCTAQVTGGSIYNIDAVRAGKLQFGIAQSDWQYHAFNGTSEFEGQGPFPNLRSVFSIHAEQVTIVARRDADIAELADLKGKRVNIGNPGSGERGTWDVLEKALGWTGDDLAQATELKSAEVAQALCDNKIDAYFWLAGHPSGLTQETMARCDAVLAKVRGPAVEALLAEHPYYRATVIPAGMYPDQEEDVETFGVSATFFTSAVVPEDVVYMVVQAVFSHFKDFKNFYPAFATLTEKEMISVGLSAPLHPGAIRYYKERGWM